MPAVQMKNIYEFYKLTNTEAASLIGRVIKEDKRDWLYFPVGLAAGNWNYGKPTGLIAVSPVMGFGSDRKKWFRVAAFSPDDLDMTLDFLAEHTFIRQDIIDYIKKMPKLRRMYRDVLTEIQNHFKAGTIT